MRELGTVLRDLARDVGYDVLVVAMLMFGAALARLSWVPYLVSLPVAVPAVLGVVAAESAAKWRRK